MVRLYDLLPELEEDSSSTKVLSKKNESTGKKRRAWLVDSIEDSKGSIDTIDKPDLPMNKPLIEPVSKGSMNQVYKPDQLCFKDLRSNPLQLFRFLFQLARNAGDDYKTPRVMLREMMLHTNISKDSARTALRFLLKHKFIERIEFKAGNLGWSRYQLNEKICGELERGLSKGFIDPFDSNKNKLLSFADDYTDLWEEVDFSGLECIGFNKNHLLQIKTKTTPAIAQESINHFSYSLKHNKKTKEYPNPLATLIAVLKRGEAWIEPNYQSPQEIAQLKILEARKSELERKKFIEDEIYKVSFEEWKQCLTQEEIETFAPDLRKRGDPTPPIAKLSAYFKENIWKRDL